MKRDVTAELKQLLAHNRGPSPHDPSVRVRPTYGVEASFEDECTVQLRLTFKANEHDECQDAGCHVPIGRGGFAALRDVLRASDFVKLTLSVEVIGEEGARFLRLDGSHQFSATRAFRYRQEFPEW